MSSDPPVSRANAAAVARASPAVRRRLAERLEGKPRRRAADEAIEPAPLVEPERLVAKLSDAEVELLVRVLESPAGDAASLDAESLSASLSETDLGSLLRALDGDDDRGRRET